MADRNEGLGSCGYIAEDGIIIRGGEKVDRIFDRAVQNLEGFEAELAE